MSLKRTLRHVLALTLATCVSLAPASGFAAPATPSAPAAQTATDKARVDRAVARLEALRRRSADLDARVQGTLANLDGLVAEESAIRERLAVRAVSLYRSGEIGYTAILLTADSIEELTARWDLLLRLSVQDAEDLLALARARAKTERAARSLVTLQAQQMKAADQAAIEVAAARKALANSTAALKAYEERIAKAARLAAKRRAAARAPAPAPSQTAAGSGEWGAALASHYGVNFTGKGASGARITPYSMMVAHKTLPFHTLIEFEYNGKRCVASVEDRGPYTKGREFDLGPGVVRALGFSGVRTVRYRVIGR